MFDRSKVPLEDWDFRDCTMGEAGSGSERDFFLSTHFTDVVAVNSMRLEVISLLVEDEFLTVDDRGEFATFTISHGASFLKGMAAKQPRGVGRRALKTDGARVREAWSPALEHPSAAPGFHGVAARSGLLRARAGRVAARARHFPNAAASRWAQE